MIDVDGLAIVRDQWTGTVTFNNGGGDEVVTVTGWASAWGQADYVATTGPAWVRWDTDADGKIRFYYSSGNSTLAFSSTALRTRFGYASSSYGSAASHTAESLASGVWQPHETESVGVELDDVVSLDGSARALNSRSVRIHDGGAYIARVVGTVSRAQALRLAEHWSLYLGTPAAVDLREADDTLTMLAATKAPRIQTRSGRSGVADVTVVLRGGVTWP